MDGKDRTDIEKDVLRRGYKMELYEIIVRDGIECIVFRHRQRQCQLPFVKKLASDRLLLLLLH